jgi:hypothetical protein
MRPAIVAEAPDRVLSRRQVEIRMQFPDLPGEELLAGIAGASRSPTATTSEAASRKRYLTFSLCIAADVSSLSIWEKSAKAPRCSLRCASAMK